MVCDEFEFQGLREILFLKEKLRKRMFPRVVKRFLDSRVNFVLLTDVFRNLRECIIREREIYSIFECNIV